MVTPHVCPEGVSSGEPRSTKKQGATYLGECAEEVVECEGGRAARHW